MPGSLIHLGSLRASGNPLRSFVLGSGLSGLGELLLSDAQFGLLRFPAGLSALSSAAGVAAGVGIAATGLGEAMGAMGAASTGERMVSGDIEIATGGGDGRAERGGGTAK